MSPYLRMIAAAIVLTAIGQSGRLQGQVPSYANLYDPLTVLNLNLELDPADWQAIKADETYSIHKPAYFWAYGENKIIVDLKRKPTQASGEKVSLKIDINEYFDDLQWHGVKKLSLENGADSSVVKEGMAWYLQRQTVAVCPTYKPPLASWVNITVNGQLQGVYANVEQPDKTFLRNRDLWVPDHSWLYKQGDLGPPELDAGSGNSPTYLAIGSLPTGYEPNIENLVDVTQMLVYGAADNFTNNGDGLFTKGKNFFFADFDAGYSAGKRLYIPWDLDAVFGGKSLSIYKGVPAPFQGQYTQLVRDLLDGPLSVDALNGFVSQLEAVLTPSLLADLNSNIGQSPADIAGHFDGIRNWITQRHAKVLLEVGASTGEASTVPEPATMMMLAASTIAVLRRRRRPIAA